MSLDVFEEWESEVRGYIRLFPTTFDTARGSLLIDEDGSEYIDFFAGEVFQLLHGLGERLEADRLPGRKQ